MKQKYLILFGALRHNLCISPATPSLTIFSLDEYPSAHLSPSDFYLHQEAIQPIGGLKSYQAARQLFVPIQSALVKDIINNADIYILGRATCIVSNCILPLLQQLGSKHRITIAIAEPFTFESGPIPQHGVELIAKLKGLQTSMCTLITRKYDAYLSGKTDFSFEKVFQCISEDLLAQLELNTEINYSTVSKDCIC